MRRTTEWAAPPAPRRARAEGQLRFAIVQGGTDPELRRRSVEELARARLRRQRDRRARDRRGPRRDVRDDRLGRPRCCPPDKPRYFMGIGDAEGILEVIEAGRRHVRLRAADAHRAHRQRDHVGGPAEPPQRPLRPRPARRSTRAATARPAPRFSRAYIRHLVNQNELLGLRLLSLHNLRFLLELTRGAREAIEQRTFGSFKRDALERLDMPTLILIARPLRLRAGSCSCCPSRRRQRAARRRCRTRSRSATRSSPPAGSTRPCVEAAARTLRLEIAPGVRRHARPARGRRGRPGRAARRSRVDDPTKWG